MAAALEIRRATPDDVPAIRALLAAHGNDDPARQLRGPDIVGPYVRHLIARQTAMVTEHTVDGVVAFGAVVSTGISWHLADLFVRPDRLGTGLGRPLLAAVFADRWPRTTFSSDDPRALPLYVRAGMTPRWVSLYLRAGSDVARQAAKAPGAAGYEAVDADASVLASLELDWTGADRRAVHELWMAWPGADPFVVRGADGPVAVGYGRDRQTGPAARAVDRLVIRPDADPVGPVLAAIGRSVANGETLDVTVPGPHPALPVLLELGFRIDDRDVYCAGPTDPVDPERLLPNGGLL